MKGRTIIHTMVGTIGLLALTGCPDPAEKFQAFQDRFTPIALGGICLGTAPAAGAADGEYYFALTPTDSPTKPAPFLATLTTSNGELTVELLPLNADDRMSVAMVDPDMDGTFEPATSETFGPFPIGADGTVTLVLDQATVPGDTNPLTMNTLTVDAELLGAFCTDDPSLLCGSFTADVTAPFALPLEGSWAMQRIDGDYPEPPIINCDGDTAAPF
jgi:hypothetical protein